MVHSFQSINLLATHLSYGLISKPTVIVLQNNMAAWRVP